MAHKDQYKPFTVPPTSPNETYVTISALEGGMLTLPESLFVADADPKRKSTVPSLSFLIQHPSTNGGSSTKLVFDLGLKRDLTKYPPAQQAHISQRQPIETRPDVADSLRSGGIDPAHDVDYVILSHVHWDHVGTPSDFPNSKFIVGSGTIDLLKHGASPYYPAETFDPVMLPHLRTLELPPTGETLPGAPSPSPKKTTHTWAAFPHNASLFPRTIDFFSDSSLYIIDAPGHLYGHINLLARIAPGKWVYLGGDCCHDIRILRGEKDIAMYDDGCGGLRSVHVDVGLARDTINRVGRLLDAAERIEVVVAHDKTWSESNRGRFLPGTL
ncbi:hypothetical protein Plec18167_009139 [Paecilomyces lecythidis]|uniref:Metallo-hydrolase/oxidoreductase n=1 Tax=Paecilomyces lecythidis TaxID=3004212 RepID=A0ABR3WR53_9EURO